MAVTLTYLSLWLGMLYVNVYGQTPACTKVNSCSCSMGDGLGIDLSPLKGNPKFKDLQDPAGTASYSYNPCDGFTEGTCNNVAVCQNNGGTGYYECGSQDSAAFDTDPYSGAVTITYQSTDSLGTTRTSIVTLLCTDTGPDTLTVLGETGFSTYTFVLSSPYACATEISTSGAAGSMSVGSILVIAFLVIVCVYFVAGVMVSKFAQKKQGKEIIPNITLWSSLPGLIKDGTLFVVRRGKGGGYSSV